MVDTIKFLECCKKHGISIVSVNVLSDRIKACDRFPFNPEGNVFADGNENGNPAIWNVVEELGIGFGCGNNGQHQITFRAAYNISTGVYGLQDGEWARLEDVK